MGITSKTTGSTPATGSVPATGRTDGTIATPDEVRASQEAALNVTHEQERKQLERKQRQERAALDPSGPPAVDEDAHDATRPRGPEAPFETLKPSQRQGLGIPYAQEQNANPITVPDDGIEQANAQRAAADKSESAPVTDKSPVTDAAPWAENG